MKKEDHHGRRTFRRLFIFKQSEGPIDHRQARWRRRDPNSKKPKKISTRLPRRFPTRNEGEEEKDMGIVKRPIRVQSGRECGGGEMDGGCLFLWNPDSECAVVSRDMFMSTRVSNRPNNNEGRAPRVEVLKLVREEQRNERDREGPGRWESVGWLSHAFQFFETEPVDWWVPLASGSELESSSSNFILLFYYS